MKEKYIVHITTATVKGILLEKSRHPKKECIVQMAGVRKGNDFYFDMVADSGIHATYEVAMCEKDHEYVDHLTTRLSEYYVISPNELTVSQLHFHPSGYERFSPGDGPANRSMARTYGGAVMGLGFVDPKFRIRFWYIDESGKEFSAKVVVDNEGVTKALPKKSVEQLVELVERQEQQTIYKQSINLLKKYPDFFEELKKISTQEEVVVKKQSDGALCISIPFAKGKSLEFQAKREWRKLIINVNGRKRLFHKGVIKKMLEEEKRAYVLKEIEAWFENNATYIVNMPREYKEEKYDGTLYGYFHEKSRCFNVIHHSVKEKLNNVIELDELIRTWDENGELKIELKEKPNPVEIKFYSYQDEAFSRNESIVESSALKKMQAIIPGVGSGGSHVALELAKAGIGSLVLMDDDIFAYHNISRHQCGIHDVGKFKVEAMKERIYDINPYCEVITFCSMVQHVDPEELKKSIWDNSIVICCTDNRHAAYICNDLAKKYQIPMIDAGCGPRASTGEIYYWKPGMPDYTNAYGKDIGVDYTNQEVRRMYYATEAELEQMDFQPGMSLDINVTSIFAAKLAIDLLMEHQEGYEAKLLPYIRQCTIMIHYPVDETVNPYMKLFENRKPFQWQTGDVDGGNTDD